MEKFSSDPVVAGLLKAIIERDAARQKQFEEKLRLITFEKDTMSVKLEEKMKELDWHINALFKSDVTIATISESTELLKKKLTAVQKHLRDLALRCSKVSQKDTDLQMQAVCLLSQKDIFAGIENTDNTIQGNTIQYHAIQYNKTQRNTINIIRQDHLCRYREHGQLCAIEVPAAP